MRQIARAEAKVEFEYQRSETLLSNILPRSVADRLKAQSTAVIADRYEQASVLFADLAGFTALAGHTAPDDLVRFLNKIFTRLDVMAERYGLEKIKTSGDAYLVVSGVPEPRDDHAEALADFAIAIREELKGLVDPDGMAIPVRIGIESGPVVAGVVGTRKFLYDIWGDTVNVASRMESTDEIGKVQVGPGGYELLKHRFILEERGTIEVRGKGLMPTWFLIARATE
jgi:adenylate cyclase